MGCLKTHAAAISNADPEAEITFARRLSPAFSCIFVLRLLLQHRGIRKGTVIVFDELLTHSSFESVDIAVSFFEASASSTSSKSG